MVATTYGIQVTCVNGQVELDAAVLHGRETQPLVEVRIISEAGVHCSLTTPELHVLTTHHEHEVVQNGDARVAASLLQVPPFCKSRSDTLYGVMRDQEGF